MLMARRRKVKGYLVHLVVQSTWRNRTRRPVPRVRTSTIRLQRPRVIEHVPHCEPFLQMYEPR